MAIHNRSVLQNFRLSLEKASVIHGKVLQMNLVLTFKVATLSSNVEQCSLKGLLKLISRILSNNVGTQRQHSQRDKKKHTFMITDQ